MSSIKAVPKNKSNCINAICKKVSDDKIYRKIFRFTLETNANDEKSLMTLALFHYEAINAELYFIMSSTLIKI